MKFTSRWLALLAAIAGVTAIAAPAHAQATRTWVSGVGDDVNPCSRTAPCKTFAGAISKTATGGEINCIDPGGYGTVAITKSITIDCSNVMSSVLSSATNGVIVNGAGIVVRLRGLSINGAPSTATGLNGVRFVQGASLSIEDCVIFGFNAGAPDGYGVSVAPTSANDMRLYITNTTIANNGAASSGGGVGIVPTTAASTIRATLSNVRLLNNGNAGVFVNTGGAVAGASISVSIEGSRIAGNGGVGIAAAAGANGPLNLLVDGTTLTNNATGIVASGSVLGRVGHSTISNNTTGLLVVGGATLSSFGNNQLSGNGTNGSFSGIVPLS